VKQSEVNPVTSSAPGHILSIRQSSGSRNATTPLERSRIAWRLVTIMRHARKSRCTYTQHQLSSRAAQMLDGEDWNGPEE
jgi:hypothetical protein